MTTHKKELEDEYSQLLEDQRYNESIRAKIAELEKKIASVDAGIKDISELREELKNYVTE